MADSAANVNDYTGDGDDGDDQFNRSRSFDTQTIDKYENRIYGYGSCHSRNGRN